MNAYFVSDAHIGSAGSASDCLRTREFLRFLQTVAGVGTHLFIVGDLFDFWFEYRHVIPRYPFQILSRLGALSRKGIEIHYIAGNHDFALGNFFSRELNVMTHVDPVERKLGSKRFYIAHGDGVNPKDKGYRFIRKIVRHPLSNRLFRILHPDLGIAFAHSLSRLSRNCRSVKDRDAIYAEYAQFRFSEGFDCVVLGHTHRPQCVEVDGKIYINTGDWMESFTYGHFDGDRLTLRKWNTEETSLQGPQWES